MLKNKKFTAVVTVKIFMAAAFLCLPVPQVQAQANFTTGDYNLALRMALKFFGGQRCGDTHNWMLYDNPNTGNTCHLGDKYNGHDMTGGWHDCGDHIKVATTMGYAAVSLLAAYDIWPKAFEDDHSTTYGPPNGIADVLDEVKIATDFFMKSFPDENTFVYYVGDDSDHHEWVTSAFQSTRPPDKGGDPRSTSAATDKGGAQAANYASALALMAMHYPDAAYRAECREAALKIYRFARQYPTNINIPTFYPAPNSQVSDEHALMCVLLYRLTDEEQYLNEIAGIMHNLWESNSPLAWDTVADIFYYYMTKIDPDADNGTGGRYRELLRRNVQSGISAANAYGIPWAFLKSMWGTNKLAAGSAFAAAMFVKLVEDGVIEEEGVTTAAAARAYNKRIIDYMLGDNENFTYRGNNKWGNGHPFIHGFKGDMTFRVHHRNAMGLDEDVTVSHFVPVDKNNADFLFASGALIGGPKELGTFQNLVEDGDAFMETESGCDYNAPFVAAIANIVQSLDPKDITVSAKNPRPSTPRRAARPSVRLTSRGLTLFSSGGSDRYGKVEVFSASGRKIYSASMDKGGQTLPFKKPLPKAVYIVRVTGQAGAHNVAAVVK